MIAAQAEVFRRALAAQSKPFPAELPVLRNVVVAPDRQTAIEDAGPYLAASYRLLGRWGLPETIAGTPKQQVDLAELLAGRVVIGGPEECAAELTRLTRTVGLGRLVCRIQWLGMPQPLVLRTIELLAERVLPLVNRQG